MELYLKSRRSKIKGKGQLRAQRRHSKNNERKILNDTPRFTCRTGMKLEPHLIRIISTATPMQIYRSRFNNLLSKRHPRTRGLCNSSSVS